MSEPMDLPVRGRMSGTREVPAVSCMGIRDSDTGLLKRPKTSMSGYGNFATERFLIDSRSRKLYDKEKLKGVIS